MTGAAGRVVSLVPSATESLLAWGIEPIAVTRFCEHPELPQVGGTKDPDVAAIVALAPDLVVLCREENRREDADALVAAGLAVHVVDLDGVDDHGPQLAALAAAVGAPDPHLDLRSDPTRPVSALRTSAEREPPGVGTGRTRVFVPIWRRPWMTMSGGTYGSSLLAAIGFDNVFGDAASRYPEVTLDEVAARSPDLVVAPSEPYPFGPRHVAELEQVAPVVLVDGQDLFWWGVRAPAAQRRLADVLAARP
jgi:ABC-type Fe3+-hydroxamate transport system substrate-binding protein